ncbi:MAG: spore germination protein [Bacillaceae bacterium]|nr:spore germination protein [Bacillaceae bacterium]
MPIRDLKTNVKYIKTILGNPPDLIVRSIYIGGSDKRAVIVGIDGILDKDLIQQSVIKPLVSNKQITIKNLNSVRDHLLYAQKINRVNNMKQVVINILEGTLILFMEGEKEALNIDLKAVEARNIEEPKSEPVVRGPHEGFTEALDTNIPLIRKRIIDPALRFKMLKEGEKTITNICLVYIEDIADPKIVDEVIKRIESIDTEAIVESGYIEQFIEDEPQSIFPTVGNTEKPDRLVGKLLEGRVGILVDSTPVALWVPYLFIEGFQSAEDYYSRPYYSSFVRTIRHLSFWISILLPAFYVATQNFHKEMLPTELLASIAAAREGVPFPLLMEIVMMLVTFEILREAGVRMPRAIGQAVSIVGALILGEAAVNAGIVGTPTIIIVAVAGITTFIVTPFADAVTILRFLMLIPAGLIGLYGLEAGVLALLVHLASLNSFGVPYLSPVAPLTLDNWRDVFVRAPLRKMKRAPETVPQQREVRHRKPD